MKKIIILFAVITNIFFASLTTNLVNPAPKKVLAIGHRFFGGKYQENSLQACDAAVQLRVDGAKIDGVEFDVWACKTGELMVYHDRTLERVTSGTGNLMDQTFAQLRKLRLPNGQLIPTLSECLDRINHKCLANIELKGPNTAAPVAQVIRAYLAKGWQQQDFMVSSFNHLELQKFHQLMPSIPFGPLTDGVMLDYAKVAHDMGANYLVINFEYAMPSLVNDAHQRGLKLFVYTVDNPQDIRQMKSLGVDGIISNFPDRVMKK